MLSRPGSRLTALERHKSIQRIMDHPTYSHVSNEGESTPRVLDTVIINDNQQIATSTSSNVMENSIALPEMYPTFKSAVVNDYSTVSSSVHEPAQKRQRGTGVQFDEGNLVERLTGEASSTGSTTAIEAEFTWLERDPALREIMNSDHSALIQPSIEGGNSKVASAPYGDTQTTAPRSITYAAPTNTGDPPFGEQPPLPRTRLLIVKELTHSDIGTHFTGIKLPKKLMERYFPHIPDGSKGLPVTIHDGVVDDKTWNMKCTVSHQPGQGSKTSAVYRLKDTFHYVKHYSLEEGDWLKLFLEESASRYIMTFEKSSTKYTPPSYQNHLLGKTWTVIIRKMLNKNDCRRGPKSAGAIGLPRGKVEECLPPVENQRGFQMTFYDWKLVQTWVMTLKFSPHKKSRMHRLDHTAKFCALHHLQEDDWVDILKSDGPNPSYALRAWKSDELTVR